MSETASRVSFKRHHDDRFFDHIEITTVPRYKMSDMSGDLIRLRESLIELPKTDHLCFQPGCSNEATVEYRLINEYSREGMSQPATRYDREQHIRFCDEHKVRGDCGLEDADRNYEVVE